MTEHLLGLELAHWLIIAGLALVVLGLLGMSAFTCAVQRNPRK